MGKIQIKNFSDRGKSKGWRETLAYVELMRLFGMAQRIRFDEKKEKGWTGWSQKKVMGGKKQIKDRIIANLDKNDWIDAANLCMFAWNLYGREET